MSNPHNDKKSDLSNYSDNNPTVSSFFKTIAEKGDQVTFKDIYEQIWIPKKKSTIVSWKTEGRLIRNVLIPAIGDIPIKDITPQKVMPCLEPYEKKIPTLQRLCMRLNEILNFALCADLIDRNRCAKMRVIYPHRKTDHLATISASELPVFFKLVSDNDGKTPLKMWFKLMILYQLYAMARCIEVVNLKWSYIKDDVITIPANCMKGRREHRIWLCPEMMEVFKLLYILAQKEKKKSEYVFCFTSSVTGHVHVQHFTKWLQHSSMGSIVSPHGFRSTGRTWLRDIGCPTEVGEDFLAHVYGSETERSYIRSDYLELRKPYYQKWFEYLKMSWFMANAIDPDVITDINTKKSENMVVEYIQ